LLRKNGTAFAALVEKNGTAFAVPKPNLVFFPSAIELVSGSGAAPRGNAGAHVRP
jgi:hypothetical protein